ncbi:membrane protein insertase YidC [Bacillus niameyensis]|uniref:membrane protein insertase YidC n=1 Tax=Bacillus niameyensis TaxID=1522308 RepID=UPI0007841A13|nr:membrane protein insertase YidC [Bacillus niameyensis]
MKKNITLLSILVVTTMFLGGCSGVENKTGFFYNTFVRPFIWAIDELGSIFGGNYGIALIIITIIIRLILMPFMLKVYKNQQEMKVKMDKMKPEMEDVQKRMKEAKTPEEQKKVQQEMLQLYQKHNVNPLGVGCLPMIIQMPILMGLYWAIRASEHIASQNFLWFNLGTPDLIMMLIAGAVYFLQANVSMATVPEAQKKQMKMISYLSPIMIMFISFSAPAALPLYWAVGGIFLIFQTWLGRKIYMKPEEKVEEKNNS